MLIQFLDRDALPYRVRSFTREASPAPGWGGGDAGEGGAAGAGRAPTGGPPRGPEGSRAGAAGASPWRRWGTGGPHQEPCPGCCLKPGGLQCPGAHSPQEHPQRTPVPPVSPQALLLPKATGRTGMSEGRAPAAQGPPRMTGINFPMPLLPVSWPQAEPKTSGGRSLPGAVPWKGSSASPPCPTLVPATRVLGQQRWAGPGTTAPAPSPSPVPCLTPFPRLGTRGQPEDPPVLTARPQGWGGVGGATCGVSAAPGPPPCGGVTPEPKSTRVDGSGVLWASLPGTHWAPRAAPAPIATAVWLQASFLAPLGPSPWGRSRSGH